MIARSEAEFEAFQKMDQERRELERESNAKPRLMDESELPDWILRAEEADEEGDKTADDSDTEDAKLGRKSRHKKEIDYSDSLTEKEWLKVIGAMDEETKTNTQEEKDDRKEGPSKGKSRPAVKRPRHKDEEGNVRVKIKKLEPSEHILAQMRKLINVVIDFQDW